MSDVGCGVWCGILEEVVVALAGGLAVRVRVHHGGQLSVEAIADHNENARDAHISEHRDE